VHIRPGSARTILIIPRRVRQVPAIIVHPRFGNMKRLVALMMAERHAVLVDTIARDPAHDNRGRRRAEDEDEHEGAARAVLSEMTEEKKYFHYTHTHSNKG